MPFWLERPSVLWNVRDYRDFWPVGAHTSPADQYNAWTRCVIILTLLLVLLTLNPWNLAWGALGVGGLALAYQSTQKSVTYQQRQSVGPGATVLQPSDPFAFVPTEANPHPQLLDGVAPDGTNEALQNPYHNPLPYDSGVAVRSRRSVYQPKPEPWINNLYRGSGELSLDLFAYPLPDQTLMARPVFWPDDPRPDIVSSEARVADRWMTY